MIILNKLMIFVKKGANYATKVRSLTFMEANTLKAKEAKKIRLMDYAVLQAVFKSTKNSSDKPWMSSRHQ